MDKEYPQELRDYVIEVYRQVGPAEATRQTGVCRQTIHRWANDAGVKTEAASADSMTHAREMLHLVRERIRTKLNERTEEFLDRLADETDPRCCRDLAWCVGVLYDKVRLEAGEATGRTEVVTIDAIDREIARLEAELARQPIGTPVAD